MSLYDDYVEFTKAHKALYGKDALVLIEVGSFMEFYDCGQGVGADVSRVCSLLNIQSTRKNKSNPDVSRSNPALGGFPRVAINKFIPLLMDACITVAMVMQVTPPPNPKRSVVEVLSPSTWASSMLLNSSFDSEKMTELVALVIEQQANKYAAAGWSIIDVTTGRCSAGQIISSSLDRVLDDLRFTMSTLYGAECVVTLTNVELSEVVETLGLKGNVILRRDVKCLDVEYQNAVLRKAYPSTGMLTPAEHVEMECSQQALAAFVSAIEFAHDHCEASVSRLQKPSFSPNASFLTLSPDALRHLDIIDALLPLLSRCRTAGGRRTFRQRLFQVCTFLKHRAARTNERTDQKVNESDQISKMNNF
jgi:DNA mismatch repair protein MutS